MNRYEYDWFWWHIQVCIASICKHLCWPMWWSRYIYSTPLLKITVTHWTKGLWFQESNNMNSMNSTRTNNSVAPNSCHHCLPQLNFFPHGQGWFFHQKGSCYLSYLWCLALWHHKNSDGSHSSPGTPWVHCGLAECRLYRPKMWPGHQQKHWTCRTQQEE